MSLAYYPMYPDDFEADTAHLTLAEDGAYNRLLRLCWRSPGCSVPSDRTWIYRRLRAHSDEDKAVVDTVLDEFFVEAKGRLSNARLTKEWLAANAAHERRKNAGSKGGKNKSLKNNETEASNAVAKPKQPEPEPYSKKEEPNGSSKKGSRLPEDWTLPSEWRDWATAEGMDELSVHREAERFRDYWLSAPSSKGVKSDWQATWRNWVRKAIDESRKGCGGRKAEPQPGDTRTLKDGTKQVFMTPFDGWVRDHG